jgi:hypothetical protein
MQLYIKTPRNNTISLHVDSTYSISQVKKILCDREGIPISEQRLIFSGKQLEDSKTIAFYDIQKDSTLDLLLRLRGGLKNILITFDSNFSLSISSSGVLTAQVTGTYSNGIPSASNFILMNRLYSTTTEPVPAVTGSYQTNINSTFTITFTVTVTDSGFSTYYKQLMRYAFYITTTGLSTNVETSTLINYLFIPNSSSNIQMNGNTIKSITTVDLSSGNKSVILPPVSTAVPIIHFKITAVNSPYIFQIIPHFTLPANYILYDSSTTPFPTFDSTIDGTSSQLYFDTVNHTVSLMSDRTNWTVLNKYSDTVPIVQYNDANLPSPMLTEQYEINAIKYTYESLGSYNNILLHPMTSSYLKYVFLKNNYSNSVTFTLYFPSGAGVDNSTLSYAGYYNSIIFTLPSTKVAGLIITYINSRYYIISAGIIPDYSQTPVIGDPTITITKTINFINTATQLYMPLIIHTDPSVCRLFICKVLSNNNITAVAQTSGVFIMNGNYTAISMAGSTVLWFIINVNNGTSAYLPVSYYVGAGAGLTYITYPSIDSGGGGGPSG